MYGGMHVVGIPCAIFNQKQYLIAK